MSDCCLNCVTCPGLKKSVVLATYNDITPETRAILRKMDALTLTALKILPPDLIKKNLNPWTNEDIKTEDVDLGWRKNGEGFDDWRKVHVTQIKKRVSPRLSTYVLKEDDFFGKYTCIDSAINKGMSSSCLLPMIDQTTFFDSPEQADRVVKDLDLVEGMALPESYDTDFDMLSDESFSRIFFYGLCAPLVAVQKPNDPAVRSDLGPYVVDLPMQDLPVRDACRPYGARIHFGKDQIVTAIFDYHQNTFFRPGDEGWEVAKLLAKVSAFTLVTAREHLIWSHLVLSNSMTTLKTLTLPPSHTLRRLLTVFTFRATEVNLSAFGTLVVETGILHRALGMEFAGMETVFDMAYDQCNIYEPFPEHKLAPEISQMADEGKFPYVTQGREYWSIVHNFVSEWIAQAGDSAGDKYALEFYNKMKESSDGQTYVIPDYSPANMINLLTQCIFVVTAHHELVGCVIDYIKLPSRAGFRLLKDHTKSEIDVQSFILGCLIGASTAIRMPALMKSFDHYFGDGGAPAWERDVWNKFVENMQAQSQKVQNEDKTRTVEFKYFDPARFECSVSV